MSSFATVLVGLVGIVVVSAAVAVAGILVHRHRPLTSGVYALRDDSALDPVSKPLRAGCASLEIGVWLDQDGRLQVGGDRVNRDAGNAIGPLVLRPLALRAQAYGGLVRPAQRSPVTLMVEILETEPDRQARAYESLLDALGAYPSLWTRIDDDAVTLGAVTVVLTGVAVPRHLVSAPGERVVFCDGNFGDIGAWGAPVALVPTVSEHWSWRFGWDGTDEISIEERVLLRQLVAAAHADGREVRIFGIPDRRAPVREAFWRELRAAGVDVISTRKPRQLARFLRTGVPVTPAMPVPIEVPGRGSVWRPADEPVAPPGSLSAASAR